MDVTRYLARDLPARLRLAELALDVGWSWSDASDTLWRTIDAEVCGSIGNPWLIVKGASNDQRRQLVQDRRSAPNLIARCRSSKDTSAYHAWFD